MVELVDTQHLGCCVARCVGSSPTESTYNRFMIKKRKPRGRKLNGRKSEDMCPFCYTFRCDSYGISPKLKQKMDKRIEAGLCVSCGKNPCGCKSSLSKL